MLTDRHRGLALGFEMRRDLAQHVIYDEQRSISEATQLISGDANEKLVNKFLRTKYVHWHYEQEVRVFTELKDSDPETGLYFSNFSDELRLSEVIIGGESEVTRFEIGNALAELGSQVAVRSSRLAFKTYRVTTQHDQTLWR